MTEAIERDRIDDLIDALNDGVDGITFDRDVLEMCYKAAVEWYKAAGVKEEPQDPLWLFWACNLAAWMYDNRGNADAAAAVPVYIVTSVHALRKQEDSGR